MDLEIVSLHNHGNADKEYVLLRTTGKVNLHDYILFDNSYGENHKPSNIHRHMYWFPKITLDVNWQVYLFTKEGTNAARSESRICNLYWNSKSPIWNDDYDTAHLIETLLVDKKTMRN